jgi:hypothetical protein
MNVGMYSILWNVLQQSSRSKFGVIMIGSVNVYDYSHLEITVEEMIIVL